MVCGKCGAQMEANEQFCPVCGERTDTQREKGGVKPRRQYNTVVFVVLSWLLGGLIIGINDFYAGFIKMGIYRTVAPIIGIIMMANGFSSVNYDIMPLAFGLLGSSILIGLWELFMLSKMAYMLENGQVVMIRQLDMKLDRKGVERYLINTYGCGLKG